VLTVLEDHGEATAADGSDLPHAARLNRLNAHRPGRQQSTEQHSVIAEPHSKRLIPVPWLQWLTRTEGHIPREHDLTIVTADDPFAPGQLDFDRGHSPIIPDARRISS
jgi:hypothetical protein